MSVIVRNVQGVTGLHVIFEVCNEEYEKKLYLDQNLFPGTIYDYEEWENSSVGRKGKKSQVGPGPASLYQWPQGKMYPVMNSMYSVI